MATSKGANESPNKTDPGKFNAANVEATFMGFYNSMASSIKKYTANVNLPMRRDSEGGMVGGDGSPRQSGSRSSSISNTPVHEALQECTLQESDVPELPDEPELPPGVLSIMEGNIVFKILTEEYIEEAVGLLCNHFFKDEPLGKALYLESPREVDHWLSKVLPHMIRHEASVMAIDESEPEKPKLVGVAINSVKLKGQPPGPDDFLTWIDPKKDPKIYRIISFLNLVTSDINFYEKYKIDKLFTFELLNVDKIYGGRGIASKLVEQSINVAKERDFKCLMTETTGIFSAKIFARHGFKIIREVAYSNHRENGKLVFPSTGIHTTARVSVKLIGIDDPDRRVPPSPRKQVS